MISNHDFMPNHNFESGSWQAKLPLSGRCKFSELLAREVKVPNCWWQTGHNLLVGVKVKSTLIGEIRHTGDSGLLKPTGQRLVPPGLPSNRICYFYHKILLSNKAFLNNTYCFRGLDPLWPE